MVNKATPNDFEDFRRALVRLRESVQFLACTTNRLEKSMESLQLMIVSSRLNRHEKWLKEIAEKVGHQLR